MKSIILLNFKGGVLATTVVVQEDHVPQTRSVFSFTDAGVLIHIVRDHPLDTSEGFIENTVLQVHLLRIDALLDPIQDYVKAGKGMKFVNLHGFQIGEDFCGFTHAEFAVSLTL